MSTRTRQSNFELLRLIAMLMVMIGHAIGYVQETDLTGIQGVCKMAVGQLCLVCVNVFVMISGWFGIKASWKGAGALLFQVFFIASLCYLVFWAIGLPVSFKNDLVPYLLFGKGYWFVVSYLILYAISPVLNAFIERASEKEFRYALIFFFLAEFVYGFLLDTGHYAYGFSPLAFIGLYLLSRYANLYPGKLFSFDKWTDLAVYAGVSVISMFGFWFGYKWFGMGFHLNHYDSPLAVIASIYFLLFFSKLNFQSKAINRLAVSAFAIYLLHENSLIRPYYRGLISGISDQFSLIPAVMLSLCAILVIAFICILVDQPRIWLWNRITPCIKQCNKPDSKG